VEGALISVFAGTSAGSPAGRGKAELVARLASDLAAETADLVVAAQPAASGRELMG
jgi:hypothetical protein